MPALAALGLHHLADVRIEYIALPELVQQTITWPLSVNAVPGDEAAGRIPDPSVVTARLLAETTEAKRQASEALGNGDSTEAIRLLRQQSSRLRDIIVRLDVSDPEVCGLRDRLMEEADQADKLAEGAREYDAPMMLKSMSEDLTMEMTGRNDAVRRQRNRSKRGF